MKKRYIPAILATMLVALMSACTQNDKIKTLIVTGQGGDQLVWMTRSQAVKTILDDAGLFSTKILVSPPEGEDMSDFNPRFSRYDLVVIDYDGVAWPEKETAAIKDFVSNGGGVVVLNPKGNPFALDTVGIKSSQRTDFEVRIRIADHPVTQGLPVRWVHPQDIIAQGLNTNAEGMQVLATASAGSPRGGGGRPEPVIMTKASGNGRIFLTMLGTPDLDENKALKCSGFIVTLQRGAEWAATGKVTQEVPFDFPTAAGAVMRPDFKAIDFAAAFENIVSYDITKSTKYFTWLQSQIRKASGNKDALLKLEMKMVEVLKNSSATVDAKKLILKELSWMGTDYCKPSIEELSSVPELKDAVDFALERLK